MFSARDVGLKLLVAGATRLDRKEEPGFTEPLPVPRHPARQRHCSARARRLTRQLSDRSIRCRTLLRLPSQDALAHSDSRKQSRQSGARSCAPKAKDSSRSRGSARPRRQQYGRDAPHVARNAAVESRGFAYSPNCSGNITPRLSAWACQRPRGSATAKAQQ